RILPKLGPGFPGRAHRLWITHEIERDIEDVNADVDQRPPTLLLFVDEYAPTGNATPAKRLRPGVIDVAHAAVIDVLLEELHGTAKAVLECDLEDFAALMGGLANLPRLFAVHGERLLAQHVFARI